MFLEFLVSFRDFFSGGRERGPANMYGLLPLQSLHNSNFIPVLVTLYRAKIGSLNWTEIIKIQSMQTKTAYLTPLSMESHKTRQKQMKASLQTAPASHSAAATPWQQTIWWHCTSSSKTMAMSITNHTWNRTGNHCRFFWTSKCTLWTREVAFSMTKSFFHTNNANDDAPITDKARRRYRALLFATVFCVTRSGGEKSALASSCLMEKKRKYSL